VKLLVTNDDGVDAPGIRALASALTEVGEVSVVAPEREQSAKSHAFTLHKPLRVTRFEDGRTALSGTPADCAYSGIHGLAPTPDFVVSGINRGANLGSDVHYSGTCAAAREAVLQGVPAIAVSLYIRAGQTERHWDVAAQLATDLVRKCAANGLPPGVFLNLNVPNVSRDALRGVRITPLGHRKYAAKVEPRTDPRGNEYIWLGGKPVREPADGAPDDGDVVFARDDWATITPMRVDPTASELLEVLRGWS
jgi:5'-nucleotidase